MATTSRRTPLLLASSVRLKKSLHNPGGPLIFLVDSVLPGASNLAPLGRQAQDVKLVTPDQRMEYEDSVPMERRPTLPVTEILTRERQERS